MGELITCRECGNTKHDRGRGLCWACTKRLKQEGTLNTKYPKWRNAKEKPDTKPNPNVFELVAGQWKTVPNSAGIKVWIPDEPEGQVNP